MNQILGLGLPSSLLKCSLTCRTPFQTHLFIHYRIPRPAHGSKPAAPSISTPGSTSKSAPSAPRRSMRVGNSRFIRAFGHHLVMGKKKLIYWPTIDMDVNRDTLGQRTICLVFQNHDPYMKVGGSVLTGKHPLSSILWRQRTLSSTISGLAAGHDHRVPRTTLFPDVDSTRSFSHSP